MIVEAKQEGEELDWHTGQIKKYMRIFQTQYGLLTNGARYMFFCEDPNSDASDELVVLDCELRDLGDHRTILAAYGRESIVGEHTSLEELAEAAQAQEVEDDSGTRDLTSRERVKRIKELIRDLEEVEQGAPIEEVYQRAESEFGIPQEETESKLEKLRDKGEVYVDDQKALLKPLLPDRIESDRWLLRIMQNSSFRVL